MGIGNLEKLGDEVTAISKGILNKIIDAVNGQLLPRTPAGLPNNGQNDIGAPNNRFKNLYLSGRVYQQTGIGNIVVDTRNTIDMARMIDDGSNAETREQPNYLIPQGASGEVIVHASANDPLIFSINGRQVTITEAITVPTVPWEGDVWQLQYDHIRISSGTRHISPCLTPFPFSKLFKNDVLQSPSDENAAFDGFWFKEQNIGNNTVPYLLKLKFTMATTQINGVIEQWEQWCTINFNFNDRYRWGKSGDGDNMSYSPAPNNPTFNHGQIWSTPNVNALFINENGEVFAYAKPIHEVKHALDFDTENADNGDIVFGLHDTMWHQYNATTEAWVVLPVALLGFVLVEADGSTVYSSAVIPKIRINLINDIRTSYNDFNLVSILEQTSDFREE